jgi:hypothetical protein
MVQVSMPRGPQGRLEADPRPARTRATARPSPAGTRTSTLAASVPIQEAGVVSVDLGAWLAMLAHTDRLAWLLGQLRRPGRRH